MAAEEAPPLRPDWVADCFRKASIDNPITTLNNRLKYRRY